MYNKSELDENTEIQTTINDGNKTENFKFSNDAIKDMKEFTCMNSKIDRDAYKETSKDLKSAVQSIKLVEKKAQSDKFEEK